MTFRSVAAVAAVSIVAVIAVTGEASARSPHRMMSVDHTQSHGGPWGGPVIHHNGVPDGRVCHIFWQKAYDPWIEDVVVRKVKRCHRTW